ncbi:GNAT family N-acetyltransferase [Kordiimonas sp.]|uniref:GNAT family N-acetyltransferase n=1 Tax=Kordiimonas sp. TaxID=1970157 RepID=UPI003A91DBB3
MALELKPIADENLEAFFELINDESIAVMAGTVPHPVTFEWAKERILKRRVQEAEGTLAQRGLFEDGVLVGDASYFFSDGKVEIGYSISKNHRGRGLATEACRLAVELVRQHGITGPIHAGYAQDNPASGRVLEKVGFVPNGEAVGKSLGRSADMPLFKVIYRDDVRLRPHQAADFETLVTFVDDEEAFFLAGGGTRDTSAPAMQARIEAYITKDARFAVVLYEGAVAGYVAAFEREGMLEVSYWIGRDFWGKGIASRALGLWVTERAKDSNELHARVAKDHTASIRVLEKNGFQVAGEDRYFSPHRNAEVDEWLYRLVI